MTWKAAPAIIHLRDQIDSHLPNRSKVSDGIISNAAHQATTSDHNPNRYGVVCAIDITATPAASVWKRLAVSISNDRRVHYTIFDGVFYHHGKAPAPYTGASKHTEHIHVSLNQVATDWNDKRDFILQFEAPAPKVVIPKVVAKPRTLVRTTAGVHIRISPSLKGKVIGSAMKGALLEVIAGSTSLWVRTTRGFVFRLYTRKA